MKHIDNNIEKALKHFPHISQITIELTGCKLVIWGRNISKNSIFRTDNNTVYALIGSPECSIRWAQLIEYFEGSESKSTNISINGRFLIIKISSDGSNWNIYNDWTGSIPVYHAAVGETEILSTLESVVVAGAGFSSLDISRSGIVQLLVHGHYLGTDTLFKSMDVLPPDSISTWENHVFKGSKYLNTLSSGDMKYNSSWDDLADEMYHLTVNAIEISFRKADKWLLPLSGGMDSRLIACVASDLGIEVETITYDTSKTEIAYAKQVANTLGLPWSKIKMGTSYLSKYTSMWHDWFGSSLHSHGMYQIPMLQAYCTKHSSYMSGYIGDFVAGKQVASMGKVHSETKSLITTMMSKLHFWKYEELHDILEFEVAHIKDRHEDLLREQYNSIDAPAWQRRWFIFLWDHVSRMSFYQPMMLDYFNGVATPFTNHELMQFSLTIPRIALEGRKLQKYMLQKYWPDIVKISGTFCQHPLIPKNRYFIRSILGKVLPHPFRVGPLMEFSSSRNTAEIDCVKADGLKALSPITLDFDGYGIIKKDKALELTNCAISGDAQSYHKLRSFQALVFRLSELG